jgi:hypothetical protein
MLDRHHTTIHPESHGKKKKKNCYPLLVEQHKEPTRISSKNIYSKFLQKLSLSGDYDDDDDDDVVDGFTSDYCTNPKTDGDGRV